MVDPKPRQVPPAPPRHTWSRATLSDWQAAARAELDGGDIDTLITPLDDRVDMAPLFWRAPAPPEPSAPKPNATPVASSPTPTRLAATCSELTFADESRPSQPHPQPPPVIEGYDLVRVTDPRVQTSLAAGDTAFVRRLDPDAVALTLTASPAGIAALTTLVQAGLPHVVVLDTQDARELAAPARELATTLAITVDVLRGLGAPTLPRPAVLAARLRLPLHIQTDIVTQIAKVRAGRWLWHTVMTAFEVEPEFCHARVWAKASTLCWSAIDPELNLDRAALQTFAAMVSGCEVFEPLLFDPRAAPTESLRLAANQQRLLALEAELARVREPAAGSFAIESLAAEIAKSAWSMLQAIEAAGGASRTDGGRTALPPTEATTDRVLVGTQRFADPAARVTAALAAADRPAAPYEALRQRTARHTIAALLLPFGDPTQARTHTAFATDWLRLAGIEPQEGTHCAALQQAGEQLTRHPKARIVVLCGVDDANGSFVRGTYAVLTRIAYRPLLYATGKPPAGSETWGALGFLHRGLDPVGTLHGVLDRLGIEA